MKKNSLTTDRVREAFDYDPETGYLHWAIRPGRRMRIGDRAGCLDKRSGYRVVALDRVMVREHLMIWFWVHGEWPAVEVDHVNRVRDDNRIANLRLSNRPSNAQNAPLGKGYEKRENGYLVRIMVEGQRHTIGTFSTPEEAHREYVNAKRRLHPTWTERT